MFDLSKTPTRSYTAHAFTTLAKSFLQPSASQPSMSLQLSQPFSFLLPTTITFHLLSQWVGSLHNLSHLSPPPLFGSYNPLQIPFVSCIFLSSPPHRLKLLLYQFMTLPRTNPPQVQWFMFPYLLENVTSPLPQEKF